MTIKGEFQTAIAVAADKEPQLARLQRYREGLAGVQEELVQELAELPEDSLYRENLQSAYNALRGAQENLRYADFGLSLAEFSYGRPRR